MCRCHKYVLYLNGQYITISLHAQLNIKYWDHGALHYFNKINKGNTIWQITIDRVYIW